jgi:hypothetical protein
LVQAAGRPDLDQDGYGEGMISTLQKFMHVLETGSVKSAGLSPIDMLWAGGTS